MIKEIAIGYETRALFDRAKQLQQELQLKIDNQAPYQLLVTPDKLVLKAEQFSALYADFSSKTWQKRRDAGKKQGLVRACKPALGVRIIDATAGWGRDAAILASFGAEVLMLERQPIMATLLKDALERQDEHSKKILNLKLCHIDAYSYLQNLTERNYPDVIYIDPMHPQQQKKALVKKEMQVLRQLIGLDKDVLPLLELGMTRVLKRVVLKWPQHTPPLLAPTSSVLGKTVRFDIYSHF